MFAFANAGISLGGGTLAHGGVTRVFGGVLFAKLVGKFVGVASATLLARHLGIGRLPEDMGLREVLASVRSPASASPSRSSWPISRSRIRSARIRPSSSCSPQR